MTLNSCYKYCNDLYYLLYQLKISQGINYGSQQVFTVIVNLNIQLGKQNENTENSKGNYMYYFLYLYKICVYLFVSSTHIYLVQMCEAYTQVRYVTCYCKM